MPFKSEMLTADELGALRNHAKESYKFALQAFGAGPLTPEEVEAERRGDERWANHLTEMRKREAWAMGRKPNPKPDDPEQSKRFIDLAKELGADDDDALKEAFKKIKPEEKPSPKG
jgi:hypothetical protein